MVWRPDSDVYKRQASTILPHGVAVILALTSRLLITGALHEDGLADFFDGFGGGTDVYKRQFPGMPTPLKLGLAGGPLVVAILIGRFGHKLHLVTYTTMSANLMLREIGIVLFLASVGIEAGEHFVQTVVEGSGLSYVGYGFLITVIPLLIIGIIARFYCKVNYFTLMGLIAGSNTDPPALAYANQASGNDAPAVGYSTVYPLTMFLRILAGQMILLTMM